MFNVNQWNTKFLAEPGYNDAFELGVVIHHVPNASWRCFGVHHLTGPENGGNHHIYCDVLNAKGKRIYLARLEMRQGNQAPVYATIDKPANEPGTNFPVWGETPCSVRMATTGPTSDQVVGLRINHIRDSPGNSLGHHSFYIVWKEAGLEPDPDPDPDGGAIEIEIKLPKTTVLNIPPDAAGVIRLRGKLELE